MFLVNVSLGHYICCWHHDHYSDSAQPDPFGLHGVPDLEDLLGHWNNFSAIQSQMQDLDPQNVFLTDYQSSAPYLWPNAN